MRKINPVCYLVIFLSLVALSANAADELSIRQKILMPGPLSAAHAKFETDCSNCHASFSKEALTKRCLDCHEKITDDRAAKTGFHGNTALTKNVSCETCHNEHEGRDANIVGSVPDNFNHASTGFSLGAAHSVLACASCHKEDKKYRDTESACISCHKDQDIHHGKLGENCATCHEASSWLQRLPFDHGATDFPLHGKHKSLACNNCHFGQKFEFNTTTCVSCHRSSDVHQGANGDQCESCHQVEGWKNLSFNHNETNFKLLGKHQNIPCQACHSEGREKKSAPSTCISCHKGDDIHLGRNGEHCESCHSSVAWSEVKFTHNAQTDFPLSGAHKNLQCNQCHRGSIHDTLPRDCAGCHAADDIHHNTNMTLCGTCHNTESWRSTTQFDHDFTNFPLVGMHKIVPCDTCHVANQFTATDISCGSCHENDDVHKGSMGKECNQCHTPNAWNIWQFDHEKDTGYELKGKHKELACSGCHLPGSNLKKTSGFCGTCHRNQDIHNGEFGSRCDRCHTTENFHELLFK